MSLNRSGEIKEHANSPNTITKFSSCSPKQTIKFFSPAPCFDDSSTNVLLKQVAQGNLIEAAAFIKQHPEKIFEYGSVIDYSKRLFKNISPLQLAGWQMNPQMLRLMVNVYCPQLDLDSDVKRLIRTHISQLITEGVEYIYEGLHKRTTRIELTDILKQMVEYIKHAEWTDEDKQSFWCTTIRKLQYELPPHIVDALTQNIKKYSAHDLLSEELANPSLKFFNTYSGKLENWYEQLDPSVVHTHPFAIIHSDKLKHPKSTSLPKTAGTTNGENVADNFNTLNRIVSDCHNEIIDILKSLRIVKESKRHSSSDPDHAKLNKKLI